MCHRTGPGLAVVEITWWASVSYRFVYFYCSPTFILMINLITRGEFKKSYLMAADGYDTEKA